MKTVKLTSNAQLRRGCVPTVTPSSRQQDFIYPQRLKIDRFTFPFPAQVPGHAAYWECSYSDTGFIGGDSSASLPRPEKRQSIWLTNSPYRGVVSRVLQIHSLPPVLAHPAPETLQSSLLWGVELGFRSLSHPKRRHFKPHWPFWYM